MKLKERVVSQQKDKALAHGSGRTQNACRYLLAYIEAYPGEGCAAALPHFLGYEAAILYRMPGSQVGD